MSGGSAASALGRLGTIEKVNLLSYFVLLYDVKENVFRFNDQFDYLCVFLSITVKLSFRFPYVAKFLLDLIFTTKVCLY